MERFNQSPHPTEAQFLARDYALAAQEEAAARLAEFDEIAPPARPPSCQCGRITGVMSADERPCAACGIWLCPACEQHRCGSCKALLCALCALWDPDEGAYFCLACSPEEAA